MLVGSRETPTGACRCTGGRLRAATAALAALTALVFVPATLATTTPQALPFSQNWTNTGLITVDDDWSGVPGVVGYLGDDTSHTTTDIDPQTIVAPNATVDVQANETDPDVFSTGGVSEFHITNPVVALQGSQTADAPYVVLHVSTTGVTGVQVAYNLRDIDGAAVNAAQQVALQYRVGTSGNFTNVPAGYVADATTGPSLATLVTPVSVTLPAAADNQPHVEIRIITTNAGGVDEWVGVDDIVVQAAPVDSPPTVASTTPANAAGNVAASANVDITFSEPVTATGSWFSIACTASGAHAAGESGGPTTFTLDPASDFALGESCTVTVLASQVADQDGTTQNMTADYSFSFTTACLPAEVSAIQGAAHVSPLRTRLVCVDGIVTARSPSPTPNGFYIQDPTPDADDATSEGIFVFTSSVPAANVGDHVSVTGRVDEFRPGGAMSANLTTTELTSPTVGVNSTGNLLPAATVVGAGGRVPPNMIIEDDATGDVETSGVFDPATDGIDFYESLEGMRVQVNNPVATGPSNSFGEVSVLADDGAGASVRTVRGGVVIQASDFNPERIILDDTVLGSSVPTVNVGDHFNGPALGVLDYSFGNFKLELTSPLTGVSSGLAQEITDTPTANQVAVGSLNVENLDPGDSTFAAHASIIVDNLKSPDILALQEIQDNNGVTNDGTTDASTTFTTLINAITMAGGPTYAFAQVNPTNNADGGEPGGNIRVGYLYRTDRGLSFTPEGAAGPTDPNGVDGTGLTLNPGRIAPTDIAFTNSRKPLAAEFTFGGVKLFVINNHFNSKGGDHPLFGRFQPPVLTSEAQRIQQTQIVNDFVDAILGQHPTAAIIVLGDLNDFEFSPPLATLKGDPAPVLTDLVEGLPQGERYTYVFDGNSQALDHILVSEYIRLRPKTYDIVHVNSEFAGQVSDHDPEVLRFGPNSPTAVVLRSLSARRTVTGVVLRWRTGAESDVLGFNVYRAGRKLNARLIRASGRATGARYRFTDRRASVLLAASYRLQVVRLDGTRGSLGTVGVR